MVGECEKIIVFMKPANIKVMLISVPLTVLIQLMINKFYEGLMIRGPAKL